MREMNSGFSVRLNINMHATDACEKAGGRAGGMWYFPGSCPLPGAQDGDSQERAGKKPPVSTSFCSDSHCDSCTRPLIQ